MWFLRIIKLIGIIAERTLYKVSCTFLIFRFNCELPPILLHKRLNECLSPITLRNWRSKRSGKKATEEIYSPYPASGFWSTIRSLTNIFLASSKLWFQKHLNNILKTIYREGAVSKAQKEITSGLISTPYNLKHLLWVDKELSWAGQDSSKFFQK